MSSINTNKSETLFLFESGDIDSLKLKKVKNFLKGLYEQKGDLEKTIDEFFGPTSVHPDNDSQEYLKEQLNDSEKLKQQINEAVKLLTTEYRNKLLSLKKNKKSKEKENFKNIQKKRLIFSNRINSLNNENYASDSSITSNMSVISKQIDTVLRSDVPQFGQSINDNQNRELKLSDNDNGKNLKHRNVIYSSDDVSEEGKLNNKVYVSDNSSGSESLM